MTFVIEFYILADNSDTFHYGPKQNATSSAAQRHTVSYPTYKVRKETQPPVNLSQANAPPPPYSSVNPVPAPRVSCVPSQIPPRNVSVDDPFTGYSEASVRPAASSQPILQPFIKLVTHKQTKPSMGHSSEHHKTALLVIDLDKELPGIIERIKTNPLPNFQNLNKQLTKNKPLSDVRKLMVNDKYLSDVKFITDSGIFFGHKMILITASFLFYEAFEVKGQDELVIKSIDSETFEMLIAYCYTEKLKVTEDNVLELLLGANKLQIRQATNVCHGFISNLMNESSIFAIFEKALELKYEPFQKKCLEFINKNEDKCFVSNGFFAISLPSLMKILEVCKYQREKVEEIVEKWTNGTMGGASVVASVPVTDTKPKDVPKPKPKGKDSRPKKNNPNKRQPNMNQVLDLMSLPVPNMNTGPPLIPPFQHAPMNLPAFNFLPPQFNQRPPMFSMPPNMPMFNQPPQRHQFRQPHPNQQAYPFEPQRPFAGRDKSKQRRSSVKNEPLISIDDDDDNESIISKDDELDVKIKISVLGPRQQLPTEFARLDFICKRSMLIHDIYFSENLAAKSREVKVTISVFEGNKRSDIHNRTINTGKAGNLSCEKTFCSIFYCCHF